MKGGHIIIIIIVNLLISQARLLTAHSEGEVSHAHSKGAGPIRPLERGVVAPPTLNWWGLYVPPIKPRGK